MEDVMNTIKKLWTKEQLEIQKKRVEFDAKLLKSVDVEFVIDEESTEPRLAVNNYQIKKAKKCMDISFKKRAILSEIKKVDTEIDAIRKKLEKQFSSSEKKELRRKISEKVKFEPLGETLEEGGMVIKAAEGLYTLSKFSEEYEYYFKGWDGFIEKNDLDVNYFFGFSSKRCLQYDYCYPKVDYLKKVLKIIENDKSKKIRILVPCESGYSCASSENKSIKERIAGTSMESKDIACTGALDKDVISDFSKKFQQATGKKIYHEHGQHKSEFEDVIPLKNNRDRLHQKLYELEEEESKLFED